MFNFEIEEIKNQINKVFECDLLSKSREANHVNGRRAFCYYLRRNKKMTYESIAVLIDKNHATVMAHEKRHNDLISFDKLYRDNYNSFVSNIKPRPVSCLCKEITFNIQRISTNNFVN